MRSRTAFLAYVILGAVPFGGLASPANAADPPSTVQQGERFYRTGVGTAGTGVATTAQGDLKLQSTTMPCVNCHRRSGWGTTEGQVTVPPITSPRLFNPVTLGAAQMTVRTTGPGTRPAYDDVSLGRALREGVDSAGRPLSPTMPRYALGAADLSALTAYLRTLSATPAPGVTATTLHLATIVSAEGDPSRRDAVLNVLRAFVQAKNGGTRNEAARRDRGGFDMKDSQGVYRTWVLHEWTVSGPARDWPAQLDAQYASQPVFAVVSGAVTGDWAPIHRFCETRQLACLFPDTPLPLETPIDDGFYTLYLSRGLPVESAALGHFFTETKRSSGPILQVLRCAGAAESAARDLAEALKPATGASPVRTVCVPPSEPLTGDKWRTLLGGAPVVVAWLGAADLAGLAPNVEGVKEVYLSASLLGDRIADVTLLWPKAYLVSPFVAPDEFDRHAARALIWLKSRAVAMPDRASGVDAFFAVSLVAEALALPRGLQSREYFLEQIEHMVGRSPLATAFPSVALGPVRRFASLGSYILKVPSVPGGAYEKVGPWFVPEGRAKAKEIQ